MSEYLFLLGREPVLSARELEAYLMAEGLAGRILGGSGRVLHLDIPGSIRAKEAIHRLGGVVRIADKPDRLSAQIDDSQLEVCLCNRLRQTHEKPQGKLIFGLSVAAERPGAGAEWLRRIALGIKRRLKTFGISARYVLPERGMVLSGAQVEGNGLLGSGIELLLAFCERGALVGQSVALQSYAEDAARDMEKPHRRLREGLLPPKIARAMVNLSRQPGIRTVLDPFCGSGVVLMEAMAMGLEPIGADSSGKAVEATKENLRWLGQRTGIPVPEPVRVTRTDAKNLSEAVDPLSVDAVATEPYLGPPLQSVPERKEAVRMARDLRELYIRVLGEIRIVLRPGGRCVFVTPVFNTREGPVEVEIAAEMERMGYQPCRSLWYPDGPNSLIHGRSGQRVRRRIWPLVSGEAAQSWGEGVLRS